jgi:hypothetical protein
LLKFPLINPCFICLAILTQVLIFPEKTVINLGFSGYVIILDILASSELIGMALVVLQ